MKMRPSRGNHLPILMKLFSMTHGTILELGSGMYSTPYLHWACYPTKRRLVTYEDHPKWIDFARMFVADFHTVHFVSDWNSADLSESWSIVLVDHDPISGRKRAEDVKRITHADYVVCHDSENGRDHVYRYSTILRLFRYRWKYTDAGYPYTTVFSNKYPVEKIV